MHKSKFVSCLKKGQCVSYYRGSQLRIFTTPSLVTSNPFWTKEKAGKRMSLLMGAKFCGTSTAPANFHGKTETAILSQNEKTDFANAFGYHQHLSYMIPQLQWWISSSLLYVHFRVTGALWHLWHGTRRTQALLELRLEWRAWIS